jgi:hypothetical protein
MTVYLCDNFTFLITQTFAGNVTKSCISEVLEGLLFSSLQSIFHCMLLPAKTHYIIFIQNLVTFKIKSIKLIHTKGIPVVTYRHKLGILDT